MIGLILSMVTFLGILFIGCILFFDSFFVFVFSNHWIAKYFQVDNVDIIVIILSIVTTLIYTGILGFLKKKIKILYIIYALYFSLFSADMFTGILGYQQYSRIYYVGMIIFGLIIMYIKGVVLDNFMEDFFDYYEDDQYFFGIGQKNLLVNFTIPTRKKINNHDEYYEDFNDFEDNQTYENPNYYNTSSQKNSEFYEKYTYYCYILGLDTDTTVQKVKKSYNKLALVYHPDQNDSEIAKNKFLEIQEAKDFLTQENIDKFNKEYK